MASSFNPASASPSPTAQPSAPIPVIVNGATGKMGREVIKAVSQAPDLTLLAAIVRRPDFTGEDIGEVIGCGTLDVAITQDLNPVQVENHSFTK